MKWLRALLIILLSGLTGLCTYAQREATPVWAFGHHAGLDFRSGTGVPITTSIYSHSATSATQCDQNGDILFYANGFRIWDRQGNPMPGSINPFWPVDFLSPVGMTAIIIPHATDTDKYYVFQTFFTHSNPGYYGMLTYSIVDMKLNNGMGDVPAGENHIPLDRSAALFPVVAPGNACNYWIIIQVGTVFRAYEIGEAGVNHTPVISKMDSIPTIHPNAAGAGPGINISARWGTMIYSYTRNKLIAAYENCEIHAFDFDPASGNVSNPVPLTWAYPYSGGHVISATMPAICLSPDESKLYVGGASSTTPGLVLMQFPLSMNGTRLSVGTRIIIFSGGPLYASHDQPSLSQGWLKNAMQLGADGRIYHVFTLGQNYIGYIQNPDLEGVACNFMPRSMRLQPNTYTTSALPGPMFRRRVRQSYGTSTTDTLVCFQPFAQLQAPSDSRYSRFLWQNGHTGRSLTADKGGLYVVTSTDATGCIYRTDSISLHLVDFDISLGRDTTVCEDIMLSPGIHIPATARLRWSDGSEGESLMTNGPGRYQVAITTEEGCRDTSAINVSPRNIPINLPADTVICMGLKIRLEVGAGNVGYLWQDGSTHSYYAVDSKGLYTVIVSDGFCTKTHSINVDEVYCDDCLSGVPTAFTPNNDGRNDVFAPVIYHKCPVYDYYFAVYNRYGQAVFSSNNAKVGWDGRWNGVEADVGTYMYRVQFTGPLNKKYAHQGDVMLLR